MIYVDRTTGQRQKGVQVHLYVSLMCKRAQEVGRDVGYDNNKRRSDMFLLFEMVWSYSSITRTRQVGA